MKKNILLFCLTILAFCINAQVVTPFTVKFQTFAKGGIRYLANTTLGCSSNPTNSGSTACQTGAAEMPPLGNWRNDNFPAQYIDIDGDPATFSSSSDSLALPSCSEIIWAGLFWGASTSGTLPVNYTKLKFKINNGPYTPLSADNSQTSNLGYSTFHCFKNVTSLLKFSGGNFRVTVADIPSDQIGQNSAFAGWTIAVVYKNDLHNMRQLTVFEGLANVHGITNVDVPMSGFLTPPTGPVTFEVGIMAFQGDRGLFYPNDGYSFSGENQSPPSTFVKLSDAVNPSNDGFNSTIAYNGVLTPFRNPSLNNTSGLDADIFVPDNSTKKFIGNSATQFTFRHSTGGDAFLSQMLTTAVDVFVPDLRTTVMANYSPVPIQGDTIEYTIKSFNSGTDPSNNTFIVDTLDRNVDYVPNSLRIVYGANSGLMTDIPGDDQAEYDATLGTIKVRVGAGANAITGGTLLDSPTGIDSVVFKFKVTITNECLKLICDNLVDNRAVIYGTGPTFGNQVSSLSNTGNFDIHGCPIYGPTTVEVFPVHCRRPADVFLSTCSVYPFTTSVLLNGYSYFDSSFLPVTHPNYVGKYYAIKQTYAGCSDTALITVVRYNQCDDFDGDGIPNITDYDDDNDGITDNFERYRSNDSPDLDNDNDGIENYLDTDLLGRIDVNADGVDDRYDNDLDGKIDTRDLDSDNDGITDLIEYGKEDVDGNGMLDCYTIPGTLSNPSPQAVPYGQVMACFTTSARFIEDGDYDYVYSRVDLDSDNDGAFDVTEIGGIDLDNNGRLDNPTDIDNDGLLDIVDPTIGHLPNSPPSGVAPLVVTGIDTDGDFVPNTFPKFNPDLDFRPDFYDLDSDNDGIPDVKENGGVDANHDGVAGELNVAVPTTDMYGQVIDTSGMLVFYSIKDFDGDGRSNQVDLDSDNDGIVDIIEGNDLIFSNDVDWNGDGQVGIGTGHQMHDLDHDGFNSTTDTYNYLTGPTFMSVLVRPNRDGFGYRTYLMDDSPDYLDIDSDNDGVVDVIEALATTAYPTTPLDVSDSDGDGLINQFDNIVGFGGGGIVPVNTDAMDYPDFLDTNSDNDYSLGMLLDNLEVYDLNNTGVIDFNEISPIDFDSDGDGLKDGFDLVSEPNTRGSRLNITNATVNGPSLFPDVIPSTLEKNWRERRIPGISPPYAEGDIVTVPLLEDLTNGTVSILPNDSDLDGNPIAPTNGAGQFTVDLDPITASVEATMTNASGVWTYSPITGMVTFDPANNFNGVASIIYLLCDPTNLCDTAIIQFNVSPANDIPDAVDDIVLTPLFINGANGTVNILANDTDADGNPTAPTNGVGQFSVDMDIVSLGIQTTFTNATGIWTYNITTGLVTFDPANNYSGTASITYQLCDPLGICDNALITFTVDPLNGPIANGDIVTTALQEDGANGMVNVLSNDTDPDGNPNAPTNGLGQFSLDLDPTTAGIQTTFTNSTGVWSYNTTTGLVTYDPANNFNGTASIIYELCDTSNLCDTAMIAFTVSPANDAPLANGDVASIPLLEDGANSAISILDNDVDIDGNPMAPTNGAGQFTVDLDPTITGIQTTFTNSTGVWSYNTTTGLVTYDPANNFNGIASIVYELCDPSNACDTAMITFTVSPVNDIPDAFDDIVLTPLIVNGANGTVNILLNDTDPDGNPTAPTNGVGQFTVDLDPATPGIQTTFTNSTGVWTYDLTTGIVTFDPANNYTGTATITYQLCDQFGICDNALIKFTVNGLNGPTANGDVVTSPLQEDGANGTVNILSNDTDPDGNPTAPTNGAGQFTVDLDPTTAGIQPTFTNSTGVWTYNATTGLVTFDPANDYNGVSSITYQLCDPSNSCDTAMVTFTVSPVNDLPVANDDVVITPLIVNGANGIVNVLTNDTDVDGNPTVPTNGVGQFTVDLDPTTAGIQTTFTNSTGVWTYNQTTGIVTFDPANNYTGTATIVYQLCDPSGACDNANITFTVNGNNTVDTDGDGIVDTLDLDDDNDGITDVVENGYNGGDTDGDGIPNRLDLDSDNDGINDLDESGNAAAIASDINGGGTISNSESSAGTDGIPLSAQGTEGTQPPSPSNTDGDGQADPYDLDSDNDGLNDIEESGHTGLVDVNGDGMVDGPDTDGDGIQNSADANDTIFGDPNSNDVPNNNVLIPNGSIVTGADFDQDGILGDADGNPNVYGDLPQEILIPSGYTPNSVGMKIQGLTDKYQAEIVIFNRWGNVIYKTDQYLSNPWKGQNQGDLTVMKSTITSQSSNSELVPEGTYLYIFSYKGLDGVKKTKQGYVYIKY